MTQRLPWWGVLLGLFALTDCDCGDTLASSVGSLHLELCDHNAACGCESLEKQSAVIDFGNPDAGSSVERTLKVINDNAPRPLDILALDLDDPSNSFQLVGIQKRESADANATTSNHDMANGALRLVNLEEAEIYVLYTAAATTEVTATLTITSTSATLPVWELVLRAGPANQSLTVGGTNCDPALAQSTQQNCGVEFGTFNEGDMGPDLVTGLPLALGQESLTVTNTMQRPLFVGVEITNDGIPETGPTDNVGDKGVFFVEPATCEVVAPGESLTVQLAFRPSRPGSYQGEVRFGGFGLDFRVGLQANVVGPALCVRTEDDSPDDNTLTFGDAPSYTIAQNGVSQTRRFWLSNCGYDAALEVTNITKTQLWDSGFTSTALDPTTDPGTWTTAPVPLAVGEEMELPFVYRPAVGAPVGAPIAANMTVTTNAAQSSTLLSLSTNVGPPDQCSLVASPAPVDFGWIAEDATQVGFPGSSPPLTTTESVVLTNAGQLTCTNVTIAELVADTQNTGTFTVTNNPNQPSFDLAPGESSQAIEIEFSAPNTEDPADSKALLPYRSDDSLIVAAAGSCPSDHYCVELNAISGGDPECELTYQPVSPPGLLCPIETVGFGNVNIGQSKTLDLKVTNTGSEACNITNISLGAGTSSTFSVAPPTLPIYLPVNADVIVPISFTPVPPAGISPFEEIELGCLFGGGGFPSIPGMGGGSGGPTGGHTVQFNYYSGTNSTQGEFEELALSGKGTRPEIDVIPGEIDFGEVTVGCCSDNKTVTVYNSGDGDLTISQISVLSTSAPGFYIVSQPPTMPAVVTPNTSTEFSARFCATSVGAATGVIEIQSTDDDQQQFTVPVSGSGTLDSEGNDEFTQPDRPMVDVLWVVDDSGSMTDDQQSLANNFDSFIDTALNLDTDYHLGVINTDVESEEAGKLYSCSGPLWLDDTQTPTDQRNQFRCNVKTSDWPRPESDQKEAGLQAARLALDYPNLDGHNAGFYRDEAKLYIILVTDEGDQSDGTPQQYVDYFQNLKGVGNPELLNISAISGPPPDGCDSGNNEVPANDFDYEAVETVGGQFKSICSNDWDDLVSSLGLDVFNARAQFPLSRPATATTIQVQVCDPGPANCQTVSQNASNGWTFDGNVNSVTFHGSAVPGPGKIVQVSYTAICYPP